METRQRVNTRKVRILIADDNAAMRYVLQLIIEDEKEWELCATARNGLEAVAMAAKSRPDVAILDVSMPAMDGVEATRQISNSLPGTQILILTVHNSDELEAAAVACGADGYVLKSKAASDLVPAIKQVLQHKPYFRCAVKQSAMAEESPWLG